MIPKKARVQQQSMSTLAVFRILFIDKVKIKREIMGVKSLNLINYHISFFCSFLFLRHSSFLGAYAVPWNGEASRC